MSTSPLLPKPEDKDEDDNRQDLKAKKEKVIKPLSDDVIAEGEKQQPSSDLEIPGANDDLLAELRAKTAELASKVGGQTEPKERVLKIDDDKDPKDIFKELDSVAAKNPVEPAEIQSKTKKTSIVDPAVRLVREKLAKIYRKEPDASEEAIEAYQAGRGRSDHQQFMYDLTTSGKTLADIQTEWHNYYTNLPDEQKHEVWKEFYDNQKQTSHYASTRRQNESPEEPKPENNTNENLKAEQKNERVPTKPKTINHVKAQILDKISAGGRLKTKHHIKSLFFGVGLAAIVGLIISFTLFNELFIAPFISPSTTVSATPIIGDQAGPVGPESKIIIPKINLEVPIIFGMSSIEEVDIQKALEDGVVHYASTPSPGENGNSVIVGHSSNNLLNAGKYKFAFVLLRRLEVDDTFFVQKDGVRYTYKIYKREIVSPTEVSVLQTQERANTMTLITCDPPGTTINRLIVTAEQISPDPTGNKESSAIEFESGTNIIPSAAPSLWSRVWPF